MTKIELIEWLQNNDLPDETKIMKSYWVDGIDEYSPDWEKYEEIDIRESTDPKFKKIKKIIVL